MIQTDIWLIGTGAMGIEYAKVLNALSCEYTTIGRSEDNCNHFFSITGKKPVSGGLASFLDIKPVAPKAAIVATGIESLAEVTTLLLGHGVSYILLEKPGVGYAREMAIICELAAKHQAKILLAYNRRFYASVQKSKQLIAEDGGITSFQFEFTEWSHVIRGLNKTSVEHQNWFLGNSTHVIDTAFYLGGLPKEICSYVKGGVSWHTASSVFAGAGISEDGALFSYHANWEAPGRWVIEAETKHRRFIFKPLETLQVQEIGSIAINPVEIDNFLDLQFKPGLYKQTQAFLEYDLSKFGDVFFQKDMIEKVYLKMANYVAH
jgi:predicted dehydrogenase